MNRKSESNEPLKTSFMSESEDRHFILGEEENFININKVEEPKNTQQFILREVFKLENFRGNQELIIEEALNNKDVFVLMPIGGGKSICFQIPALIDPGVTIVVSPLLSLIQDQISNLLNRNIPAVALN